MRRPRLTRRVLDGLKAMTAHVEAWGDEHELIDPSAGASAEDIRQIEAAISYVDRLGQWYAVRK